MAPVRNLGFGLDISREQARCRSAYTKMGKRTDQWNEMKGIVIKRLKTCSGSGPKVLRTVVLGHDRVPGAHFHVVAGTEEIKVWKWAQAHCSKGSTYLDLACFWELDRECII